MHIFRQYGNLFSLGGTNQLQRLPVPLEQNYIVPDERSFRQLLEYARKIAAELKYYNTSGQSTGDWRPLFELLTDSASNGEIIQSDKLDQRLENRKDWPPHLALLLALIELYQFLQQDLNELPVRHLRHYYQNELGLSRRQPKADQVHVLFELAKNAAPTLLETGTELDAGKDKSGNTLIYKTLNDVVINSSAIKEIKRLVRETDRRGSPHFFIANEISPIEGESWYTFGRNQLDLDRNQQFMQEAQIGFAIASPLLLLKEGNRKISLVLHLSSTTEEIPAGHSLGFALKIELCGEEGWLEPDFFSAKLIHHGASAPTLEIELTLDESKPAIVPADESLHPTAPDSEWPVLRCLLIGESGHYEVLNGLIVDKTEISVDVTGIKNLLVQNEEGPLKTDKPMPLFGNQPHLGSAFYIGSEEIFSKRLTHLALHLEWQDLPDDLFEHYREYFDLVTLSLEDQFIGSFQVDVEMLYTRTWDHKLLNNQALFDYRDTDTKTFTISLEDQTFVDYLFGENEYQAHPSLNGLGPYTNADKYGYVRILLTGPDYSAPYAANPTYEAFGHKAYASRYAQKAIELGQWTSGDKPVLPNAPYTPTLAALSLDYQATSDFEPSVAQSSDAFYTLEPFGYSLADRETAARLVPNITGQASLFIGLENVKPPVNLSFLFQLDKGTATSTQTFLTSGETQWLYLAKNRWVTIPPSGVLIDTTYGFQQPGIIALTIGSEASLDHNLLTPDLLWVKATIAKTPDSACRSLAVLNQAVTAELAVTTGEIGDYNEHLNHPLETDSITKLKKRVAAIKKVSQPYPSFGGRQEETDNDYFQSSSERLRHRNRAVTTWDIERLVLNEFPEVFKVKCLPHSDASAENKPGELALVIIPDLRSGDATNLLEPRADNRLMGKISDFISLLDTPFSTVNVIHPVYERILVDTQIAFKTGFDPGFYSNALDLELQRFLSPWAYEEGADILFGTRIYKSEILAFIEGKEYVDYIINFKMYHSYEGPRRGGISDMTVGYDLIVHPKPTPGLSAMEIDQSFVVGRGVEVAEASLPHAILVSNKEHRIVSIGADDVQCTGIDQLGIGYMNIGLDFYVHPK